MKKWIAVLLVGVFGFGSVGNAQAYKPTVTLKLADYGAHLALKKFPIWTHRDAGKVSCIGGKLSRTRWTCKVGLRKHRICRKGRALTVSTHDKSATGPFRTYVNFGRKITC